jgi:hypothetical protein
MERVMGIEPTLPAWKAGVLPLNYTRKSFSQLVDNKLSFIKKILGWGGRDRTYA